MVQCGQGDVEAALFEAEVAELLADGLAELGDDFASLRGKGLAGAPQLGGELLELGIEAAQLGIALLQALELAPGFVAEGDDLGHGGAVLALEGVDKVEALFKLLEAGGVDVGLVRIMGELRLQLVQGGDGLLVQGLERGRRGIHSLQLLQGAANDASLGEHGGVVLAQQTERGLAELEQFGGVAGAAIVLLDLRFFLRLKAGGGNFVGLKAEQVELLRIGLLIHDQGGLLGFEGGAAADEFGECLALAIEIAKGVQNRKLAGGVQERLVLVRAVDIHQPLAQGGEDAQRRWGAVDELAVRARAGEGALQEELVVRARFKTVLLQERLERRAEAGDVEGGLDRATVAAAANEGAVRPLAQGEVEGANEDGLAGAGLARNDVVAGLQLERQVGHEGEVLDAQGRQHVTVPAAEFGGNAGNGQACCRRLRLLK